VQRSSLVYVHQAALQHGSSLGKVVLGQNQLGTGAIELGSQPADLALDLAHDPLGRLPLSFQVVQLVMNVVYLTLQSFSLTLEPVAFRADLLQSATALLEFRVALRVRGCHCREEHQHAAERVSG
jgi:hypothetical protein